MALLRVGMAELQTSAAGDVLQALGLGSCIGLAMYDRRSRIGGMVHVMLPDSSLSCNSSSTIPAKYADTGVPELLRQVLAAGANRQHLCLKMAGGAEMFAFAGTDAPKLSIGKRNLEAVRAEVAKLGLRIDAADVGANFGRTFEVDLANLICTVRIVGRQPYPL